MCGVCLERGYSTRPWSSCDCSMSIDARVDIENIAASVYSYDRHAALRDHAYACATVRCVKCTLNLTPLTYEHETDLARRMCLQYTLNGYRSDETNQGHRSRISAPHCDKVMCVCTVAPANTQ